MDRSRYLEFISGRGLEIGALHEPSPLRKNAEVKYFDIRTKSASAKLFDELDPDSLVEVDHVGDIDRRDLRKLGPKRFDFVIATHVIEHLANPIALIEDAFFILKPQGVFFLAAPDKRFTFDKEREITSLKHSILDYINAEAEPSREHYIDFIENVLPDGKELSGTDLEKRIELVRDRREHPHVWDSATFRNLLQTSIDILSLQVDTLLEEDGDTTKFEYRVIWRKRKHPNLLNRLFSKHRAKKALPNT